MKTAAEILKRMGEPLDKVQKHEANILADRWALRPRPVLVWMKARGFISAMDLRVFSLDWKESMNLALADFWEFST